LPKKYQNVAAAPSPLLAKNSLKFVLIPSYPRCVLTFNPTPFQPK